MRRYFAYGSNLSKSQMTERVGQWKDSYQAKIRGWKLSFNVHSKKWGGGAANIISTGIEEDEVYGAIYEITSDQLNIISSHEGIEPRSLTAISNGQEVEAMTYVFRQDKPSKEPTATYLEKIVKGLGEHGYGIEAILPLKLLLFPQNYRNDFNDFWNWKLQVEKIDGAHILDKENLMQTYSRLCPILNRWNAYRSGSNTAPLETLKNALENISAVYDQIRNYTLLQLDDIPESPLNRIWHELGRVKEANGNSNESGEYYVISVCKPLMLLWGQTLAFDSKVRTNGPKFIPKSKRRWTFENWKNAMRQFQKTLAQNSELIHIMEKLSVEEYHGTEILPYGRFFDIYYF